jgi:hypothetical protein
MYGFGDFQPFGYVFLASSSDTEPTMMTSSPGFQFTGVATLCLAVSCSESTTRSTSSKFRPDYTWPGNVRELQNVVERAAILSRGPILELDGTLLGGESPAKAGVPGQQAGFASPGGLGQLEDVERFYIVSVLKTTGGVVGGDQGSGGDPGTAPEHAEEPHEEARHLFTIPLRACDKTCRTRTAKVLMVEGW